MSAVQQWNVGGKRLCKMTDKRKAADLAAHMIDQRADLSASPEEQEESRLLKGPTEFRELRRDHPTRKR